MRQTPIFLRFGILTPPAMYRDLSKFNHATLAHLIAAIPGLVLGYAIAADAAITIEQYQTHDFTWNASVTGNPFDVELMAEVTGPGGSHLTIPGFYDGDGRWTVR